MFERTDGRTDCWAATMLRSAVLMASQSLLLTIAQMPAFAADPPGKSPLPNDPMLSEQWYVYPPGDERGSPGSINAIEAWLHIRAAKPVVVALLDLGVNYRHPDLAANIWKNERETLNGKDDDGNGYVDVICMKLGLPC